MKALSERLRRVGHLVASGRVRLLAEIVMYRIWRRFHALDFELASTSELGLDPKRSVHYENGGGPSLRRLLRQLNIVETDAVLDIGSGKGGAMATLASFPFHVVDGVEISPVLAGVARENLAKLGLTNRAGRGKCRVFQADAATFTDLDDYTHIFLYNPFPAVVLKQVMVNLSCSLARRPRPMRIIYSLPFHERAILDSGLFTRSLVYQPYPGCHICVYDHDPSHTVRRDDRLARMDLEAQ